jgi:hypothetical protein
MRSPAWDDVRDKHLKDHPECVACRTNKKLQVHHIRPFHLHPELELDPKNLITLCMEGDNDCHLKIGHGGSFKYYNPDVEEDSVIFFNLSDQGKTNLIAEAHEKRKK